MNAAPLETTAAEDRAWPTTKLALFILAAFVGHIALIYALGSRKPIEQRPVVNAPTILATPELTESQSLQDPTLFALPHPRGYAGDTWLKLPRIAIQPYRWTEPPRLMALPVERLGETFLTFAATNIAPRLRLKPLATVQFTHVEPPPIVVAAQPSRLRVNGGLASRILIAAPSELPAWNAAEPLTNSLIRVMVDERGNVFSAQLLRPGSGSREADQAALKIANTVRFAPDTAAEAGLSRGLLIFEWQTHARTNGAPANR